MTTPLPNPFITPQIDPQPFKLDERAFWRAMTGTDDDPPPLFVGEPSPDFEAMLRDIATTLEVCARR